MRPISLKNKLSIGLTAAALGILPGCSMHRTQMCQTCDPCGEMACDPCATAECGSCVQCGHQRIVGRGCSNCGTGCGGASGWWHGLWGHRRSNAIPSGLPLGSTVRAHYQVMQTNGEAADFILHQNDFVGQTAELTPDGRDKILEIAARMPSTPFPVLVERSPNNSDPELDLVRRNLVAQVLADLGNADAQQRVVVSTPYGPGYNTLQAERTYFGYIFQGGGGGNFGTFGNNQGQFGGFGGGAGGGIGFGN